MLNCNGQCYLAKQLKAAEEKEQKSNSERLAKMPEVLLSFQAIRPIFICDFFQISQIEHHFSSEFFVISNDAKGLFHPPRV
jgi:hypothetical protein